jgi:hypothetical protein
MDTAIRRLAERAGLCQVTFTVGFGHIMLQAEQDQLIDKFARMVIQYAKENSDDSKEDCS